MDGEGRGKNMKEYKSIFQESALCDIVSLENCSKRIRDRTSSMLSKHWRYSKICCLMHRPPLENTINVNTGGTEVGSACFGKQRILFSSLLSIREKSVADNSYLTAFESLSSRRGLPVALFTVVVSIPTWVPIEHTFSTRVYQFSLPISYKPSS